MHSLTARALEDPSKVRVVPVWRRWGMLPAVAAVLILAVVLSLAIGARFVPFGEVVLSLFGAGDQNVLNIIGTLRVARTVSALLCGAALGIAGVLMQSLTRNPIADPGMLGVSAGASFGVVAGMSVLGPLGASGVIWFALAGAALASTAILAAATGRFLSGSPVRLVLAGVAFSAVLSGATQALVLTNEEVLDAFRFWRVGSVAARGVDDALGLVGFILIGVLIAFLVARPLNLLALGDDAAAGLGVRLVPTRILTLAAVTLLCGTATAIAGPLSFIGLVVPHLVRRLVGPDLRFVLPLSLLLAPALLLVADVLGRVIGFGGEVQVGVVMALIGGPLIIGFVLRRTGVGA